jgi:hypothetical protein
MEQQKVVEQRPAEPSRENNHKGQPYERPAIVFETQISTRAGSPVSTFRPEQDPADIWNK